MTYDPYTGEQQTSKTTSGAAVGAIAGAVIGAATSSKGDRNKGILTGALVGGAVGGGTGNYMDRQEALLRRDLESTGVSIRRDGDNIVLVMPGNITFDTNQSNLQASFLPVLDSVTKVLAEYKQTLVNVNGFTDSTGSFELNQALSERRANSVASYLLNAGIIQSRLRVTGYGPRYPAADNATPAGRAQNRRVEITLSPMG
jgi:outer membrane protein OmpA-like peptidoglycan-associated protein